MEDSLVRILYENVWPTGKIKDNVGENMLYEK